MNQPASTANPSATEAPRAVPLSRVVVYGLGAMGRPMARNLHQHGLLLGVKNRTEGKAQALRKELKLPEYADDASLLADADCVLTCVAADADLKAVVAEIKPLLKPGSVIIDSSTVSPETARQLAEELQAAGIGFLDAPMSGGVEGARKGALSFMVGGERETFQRARDVFSAMGNQITWMGRSGQGQAAKMVNQVMVAGIAQAVCEALAFAEASKLNTDKLIEVLTAGAANNWFLEKRGQSMLKNEFGTGFKLSLLHKDLGICQSTVKKLGAELPIIVQGLREYGELMQQGHGDEDISALIRLYRRIFHTDEPGAPKDNTA
jgi:3-hydroxyisobutyrate dehydrogenase